jgi:hypothetical protein
MEQQIQHLIERQQQLEAALTMEQQARSALEQRAITTPRGEESQGRANIDTRLLGKPDRFDGSDSSWKDWEFVTRSYLMAAIGGIGQGLQAAESEPSVQVQNVHLTAEQKGASAQLYFSLVMQGSRSWCWRRIPGMERVAQLLATKDSNQICGTSEGDHHVPDWQWSRASRFIGGLEKKNAGV